MMDYDLSVTSAHRPPRHNVKKENINDFFKTLESKFIVGGDYNCNKPLWDSLLTTIKDRELAKLFHEKIMLSYQPKHHLTCRHIKIKYKTFLTYLSLVKSHQNISM